MKEFPSMSEAKSILFVTGTRADFGKWNRWRLPVVVQLTSDAALYIVQKVRHSARAAVRLSLKLVVCKGRAPC